MHTITIRAYGVLGDLLKTRPLLIHTPAKTIEELLDFLSESYDLSFKKRLIDPHTLHLRRDYRIIVNGRDIYSLNRLQTEIKDGDDILFFPPVGGG